MSQFRNYKRVGDVWVEYGDDELPEVIRGRDILQEANRIATEMGLTLNWNEKQTRTYRFTATTVEGVAKAIRPIFEAIKLDCNERHLVLDNYTILSTEDANQYEVRVQTTSYLHVA